MNPDKNNKKNNIDDDKIDFSFEKEDIGLEVDKAIEKQKKKLTADEFKIEHVSDKIKFAKGIREEPPEKGFMQIDAKEATVESKDEYGQDKTEKGIAIISYHDEEDPETKEMKQVKKVVVHKGIFSIDLNNDAYFWFVRACNIFPLILDQGIRTHLDIKRAHEPEKRRHEMPWALIGLVVAGVIFIFLVFRMIFT